MVHRNVRFLPSRGLTSEEFMSESQTVVLSALGRKSPDGCFFYIWSFAFDA